LKTNAYAVLSQSQEFVSFPMFILTMEFNRSWGNVIRCR